MIDEKNENKKILFSDLDGTLLNDSKEIIKADLDALKLWLSEGNYFAICTGRPLANVKEIAKRYGLDRQGCYIIAYNGGAIFDPYVHESISYPSIPTVEARRLFREAEQAGIHVQTYERMTDTILTRHETKELQFYCNNTKLPYRAENDFRMEDIVEPPKLVLIHLTNPQVLEDFRREHEDWTGVTMDGFFTCKEYLEYSKKGVSKGKGVRQLCRYLHISRENTIGIGDERNDIQMMEEVEFSAAPANAFTDVKNKANYICLKNNQNGAVSEVIHKCL